jgi:hypothetical protein
MMGSMMSKMGIKDDPNKGQKLAAKVSEAERALEETKSRWESISDSISTESDAFHAMTNADFSEGLRAHVQQQLKFEEEKQRKWTELLRVFEQVPCATEL